MRIDKQYYRKQVQTILIETINDFRESYLAYPVYIFAQLSIEEQNELINSAQQGSQVAYSKILSGFWKCLANNYLKVMQHVPFTQIKEENIHENLNDGLYRICQCISKHNGNNSLVTFVYSSIAQRCYTYKKQHIEKSSSLHNMEVLTFRIMELFNGGIDEVPDKQEIELFQMFNKKLRKTNTRYPYLVFTDQEDFLECVDYNTPDVYMEKKNIREFILKKAELVYTGERNKKKNQILLYYLKRYLDNDPCTMQVMGVLFGCSRHTIRKVIQAGIMQLRQDASLKKLHSG